MGQSALFQLHLVCLDNTLPGHGVMSTVPSTGVLESRKYTDDTALVSSTVNAEDSHLPHSNQRCGWFKWEWASLMAPPFGKESACSAEDPGLIPGLGRPAGEGIGYPLQYSWASHMAQLVKNLPAMWEIWVQSLGWEDPLQKGKATHSSFLAWRIPWT